MRFNRLGVPTLRWLDRLCDAMLLPRLSIAACLATVTLVAAAAGEDDQASARVEREERGIRGWRVYVSRGLLDAERQGTEQALKLLEQQLAEIERVVPAAAVARLREVPLYLSPEYDAVPPRAEYHPDAGWLREHGRDPAMARAVEFTNVRIFAKETDRMPNFALHELAHAFHHRVLADGFDNAEITAAHARAVAAGTYDHVDRWNGSGRPTTAERAYALTTPQEFFAEASEAFFSRNDFFPFTRADLRRHDPETCGLIARLWGVENGGASRAAAARSNIVILDADDMGYGALGGQSRHLYWDWNAIRRLVPARSDWDSSRVLPTRTSRAVDAAAAAAGGG